MDAKDLARIEHHRRYSRPDWRRFVRPDWERYVRPAGRAAMRKDMALCDRAFETPMARRWREENEAREREQQERLEAEHQARIEREVLKIKAEIAELRYELMWAELCRKYGYNPNQPRVPAGSGIESGRWAAGGSAAPDRTRVAQYSIGTLVGQSRVRGRGWVCFYKFSFGTVMVDGSTNLGCSAWMPSAGVSHGKLIANDN